MIDRCHNITWAPEYLPLGAAYLGLSVPALVFHILFWLHVATHRSLRQMTMLWVYNYLFTDLLLIFQLFLEYIFRRTLPYCISPKQFSILCGIEAYTTAYMAILEAYILVCLNVSRYLLIVKNYNLASRYPFFLLLLNLFIYVAGLIVYLLQVEVFEIVRVHHHDVSPSCHLQFIDTKTQIGNLLFVLIIPILLNCYFMAITTIHVRRSQQAARSQRNKHVQLLVQFFLLYTVWLVLWAPNVFVAHLKTTNFIGRYTRLGSILTTLFDPMIFMFIDRRFLKVWRQTYLWIIRGVASRQIYPSTVSNELQMSIMGVQS